MKFCHCRDQSSRVSQGINSNAARLGKDSSVKSKSGADNPIYEVGVHEGEEDVELAVIYIHTIYMLKLSKS